MADERTIARSDADGQDLERRVREQTPARLMEGRVGASYRTATQLHLRGDHAAARDAVRTELDLIADLGQEFIERWRIFEVSTRAHSKEEYLLRPDLGRAFDAPAREAIREQCPQGCRVQIVIGDGLSVRAVAAQVPRLLPLLMEGAAERNWQTGRPFAVRHCRVGAMNEIGELLAPETLVLLVGERPGLATAESLSAYLAYRPRPGHTDADRNLVSNIQSAGVPPEEAAERILNLVGSMLRERTSGVHLKEEIGAQRRALE